MGRAPHAFAGRGAAAGGARAPHPALDRAAHQLSPGREHYLRWRRDLRRFHADEAARILRAEGYDEPLVDRVRQIVRKEALFTDPDVQTLEDGLNLVFLLTQFDEFRERLGDDERLVAIVRRTWRKMSARGREAALGLELSERARAIVARAIEE